MYRGTHQFQKAIEYYHQAIKLAHETQDVRALTNYYSNLGLTYFEIKEYDRALGCQLFVRQGFVRAKLAPQVKKVDELIAEIEAAIGSKEFARLKKHVEAELKAGHLP